MVNGNGGNPWERERKVREIGLRAGSALSLLEETASDWDCIVVGAGPAGSTAAIFLAQAGLRVLLLERGPYPGSKNLGGGALYAQMMEPLLPGFAQKAPLEGAIVRQDFFVITEDGAVTLGVRNTAFEQEPLNRFSVLKARFDPWLAGEAVRAGARLLVNHPVEDLLVENRRVVGVGMSSPVARRFHAPVTIIAEGAGSPLATRAGLIPKIRAEDTSLYAKEVIALPPDTIRERFGLREGQAAVIGFFGFATSYLHGTASLYTCRDCVGINAGALLGGMREAKVNVAEFLGNLKRHPFIRPLIAGGSTVEYAAHLIPDGGYPAIPEMVHDGALLVGDAAGLVNGTHGINNAAWSGKFAAEAVAEAHRRGDFRARTLGSYRDLMEESFVMKDLRAHRGVPAYYTRHRDVMHTYPRLINELAYQTAMVYPLPKREKRRLLLGELGRLQPFTKTVGDILSTLNVLR